jgi:hypothetical protein
MHAGRRCTRLQDSMHLACHLKRRRGSGQAEMRAFEAVSRRSVSNTHALLSMGQNIHFDTDGVLCRELLPFSAKGDKLASRTCERRVFWVMF